MKRGCDFIGTQDVSTTSAQTIRLCNDGTGSGLAEYGYDMSYVYLSDYSFTVGIIYVLQSRYALRISEVLGISPKNITSSGTIIVKGLKGSNDKYIDIIELRSFFKECKVNNVSPFKGISRYFVYRTYKKFNINCSESYGTKTAVTHGFRYKKVREIQEIEKDLTVSSIVLGHKSLSSTKHYE